jgi:hypothetical protein
MLNIRFGLALDGQAGARVSQATGQTRLGPLGLLALLETRLGLVPLLAQGTHALRVLAMRGCLQRACTGQRFYERSFEADELGTASTLLAWRDHWALHGWDGQLPPEAPPRLRDMAAVERLAQAQVVPGPGQRLAMVADRLGRICRINRLAGEVGLLDPLAAYPLAWRRVLAWLPTTDQSMPPPGAPAGSLLGDLQRALLAAQSGGQPEPMTWRDDGSLTVACGTSQIAAVQWLAHRLGVADERPGADRGASGRQTVIVPLQASSLLAAALDAAGLPQLSLTRAGNPYRPALQLLPLALRLLWAPLDCQALLQFLTLAVHPLPDRARQRIAARLCQTPGVGGPDWRALMTSLQADSEGDPALLAEIAFWVEPQRYRPADRAPLTVVRDRAARLADFFNTQRLADAPDPARSAAWQAGQTQAIALVGLAQGLLDQGVDRIAPAMLDKLVALATTVGGGAGQAQRRVGTGSDAIACVTDPAALTDAVARLSWWPLAAPTPAPLSAWSPREQQSLLEAGVDLPQISGQPGQPGLAAQHINAGLRALLQAQRQLTLVLPVPGSAQPVHPLWLLIRRLVSGIPVQRCEAVLGSAPVPGLSSGVPWRALPGRRRWWQLAAGTPVPWPATASFTSLELLLFNPFHWLLVDPAQLRGSKGLRLPDDFQLLGSVAHSMVEQLYRAPCRLTQTPDQLGESFDRQFDRLIDEQGAPLRAPGRRAELQQFRLRLRASLQHLHGRLLDAGALRVEPEKPLAAKTAVGALRGRCDLLLTLGSGQQMVIDMKWTGLAKYRDKLRQQAHLQLAVYGQLRQQATGLWPAVGYYLLRDGALLTPDAKHFPGLRAVPLPDGATAVLWQRVLATWQWRKAQIDGGAVELVLADIAATDDPGPANLADDGLLRETLDPRYNPCIYLAGWAVP